MFAYSEDWFFPSPLPAKWLGCFQKPSWSSFCFREIEAASWCYVTRKHYQLPKHNMEDRIWWKWEASGNLEPEVVPEQQIIVIKPILLLFCGFQNKCTLSLVLDFWNQDIESFQSVLHVSVSTGVGHSLVGQVEVTSLCGKWSQGRSVQTAFASPVKGGPCQSSPVIT